MLGPLAISAEEIWGYNRGVKHQIYITCIIYISTCQIEFVTPCWGACPSFYLNLRSPEWLTLPKPAFFEHFQQIAGHHIRSAAWNVFIQSVQSLGPLIWGLSFERWSLASWSDGHSQMIAKRRKLHHHAETLGSQNFWLKDWRSIQYDDVAKQSPYTKHSTSFFRLTKPH